MFTEFWTGLDGTVAVTVQPMRFGSERVPPHLHPVRELAMFSFFLFLFPFFFIFYFFLYFILIIRFILFYSLFFKNSGNSSNCSAIFTFLNQVKVSMFTCSNPN